MSYIMNNSKAVVSGEVVKPTLFDCRGEVTCQSAPPSEKGSVLINNNNIATHKYETIWWI